MILEHEQLTPADKMMIKKLLNRLSQSILEKIPVTMSLETGVRNLFMR